MATNNVHMWHRSLRVQCTAPTTPSSGDPVLYGQIPGVALTDEDADGYTTIALDGVWDLQVKGETTTDAAVNAGDILYYDSGVINKDSSNGIRFGYALAGVSSGATSTIPVLIGY